MESFLGIEAEYPYCLYSQLYKYKENIFWGRQESIKLDEKANLDGTWKLLLVDLLLLRLTKSTSIFALYCTQNRMLNGLKIIFFIIG